jgi:SAM-dependent methyltransferase
MNETLYAEYPGAYDALYAEKDYDAEVEFVLSAFEGRVDSPPETPRVLVVGCGTGEHSKRLRERGFEVVGVDKYEAMVERARTKSDAEFRVEALPDLPVEGRFDLVWLPFTVAQHLDPEALAEGLCACADVLSEDGLLVFDQLLNDEEGGGTDPRLWTYPSEEGTYARLVQTHEVGDAEYRWDSVVFTPDGEFFVDTHRLFDHDPEYLAGVCDVLGLSVEQYGWYDEDAEPGEDGHYVFVAS